jgi:hypothetical protein
MSSQLETLTELQQIDSRAPVYWATCAQWKLCLNSELYRKNSSALGSFLDPQGPPSLKFRRSISRNSRSCSNFILARHCIGAYMFGVNFSLAPTDTPNYFFWSGNSFLVSSRALKRAFKGDFRLCIHRAACESRSKNTHWFIYFNFLTYNTLNSISVTFYYHTHFTPKDLSSALLLWFSRLLTSQCLCCGQLGRMAHWMLPRKTIRQLPDQTNRFDQILGLTSENRTNDTVQFTRRITYHNTACAAL